MTCVLLLTEEHGHVRDDLLRLDRPLPLHAHHPSDAHPHAQEDGAGPRQVSTEQSLRLAVTTWGQNPLGGHHDDFPGGSQTMTAILFFLNTECEKKRTTEFYNYYNQVHLLSQCENVGGRDFICWREVVCVEKNWSRREKGLKILEWKNWLAKIICGL